MSRSSTTPIFFSRIALLPHPLLQTPVSWLLPPSLPTGTNHDPALEASTPPPLDLTSLARLLTRGWIAASLPRSERVTTLSLPFSEFSGAGTLHLQFRCTVRRNFNAGSFAMFASARLKGLAPIEAVGAENSSRGSNGSATSPALDDDYSDLEATLEDLYIHERFIEGTEEVPPVAILQQPLRPVCKAAAAASSAGTQTEEEVPMSGDAQVVYDEKVEKNLNGVQTEDDTRNLADCKAPTHDMSVACARMVASSWAAESAIFTNCDGELEINECKTPDDLVKWKTRNGVRKGSYRLRGTRAGIRGDINISLTMDELFTVMSGIKNPKCGEADAALFGEESDVEDFDEDSSDEDYQPG